MVLGIVITTALLAIWFFGLDKDTLLYEDGWRTKAAFYDKAVHFIIGFGLYHVFEEHGLVEWQSIVLVLVLASIFEFITHYPRESSGLVKLTLKESWSTAWRDIVATIVGALIAVVHARFVL